MESPGNITLVLENATSLGNVVPESLHWAHGMLPLKSEDVLQIARCCYFSVWI